MQLPIGLLIFGVKKLKEEHSVVNGIWYYKEMSIPNTIDEKRNAMSDLKSSRCTALNITGTVEQIYSILLQGDAFKEADNYAVQQYQKLINDIESCPEDKPYIFENVNNLKGTSLGVDTIIEVEESFEEISTMIRSGKTVSVTIAVDWSFTKVFLSQLSDF